MTSCILTVIKDEHLYLDEWLQYHLGIGVDHIFVIEDINSSSHQQIIDKYGDQVSLINAFSVLTEEERQLVADNRAKNLPGGQKTFLRAGLRYLKEHFDYDWCFVIDDDEFITFDQNQDLNRIFSLYKDYDAFIMSWKCYGANGLINKPDYSKAGVIDTYTEPVKGHVPTVLRETDKKTCYNMKKYRDEFWYSNHVPRDICNFCNTDFQKDKDNITYTNVFIRHYITRSWEEYVWKKKTRGYFYGRIRTLDNFFIMNPDMAYLKQTLKAQLEDETLVVMPYCQRGSQGNEIRLMLKAWRKFCQFKYHFAVIGEFDEKLISEFPWVDFIREPRVPRKPDQYNPHLDIQHKMEVAFNMFKGTYEGFLYVCDDFYAIKPFDIKDVTTIYYHELGFTGDNTKPKFFWKYDKWKTRQLLDRYNLPHINYTAHYPCYFEFARFKRLWDRFNMREESYVPEDVYYNSFEHEDPISDSEVRLAVCVPNFPKERFDQAVKNPKTKFVFNSVEGWSKDLENWLMEIIDKD